MRSVHDIRGKGGSREGSAPSADLRGFARTPFHNRTAEAGAVVLAAVTLSAAAAKAVDPEPLVKALLAYRIAGPAHVDALACAIVAAEIVVGAALVTRRYRRAALVALAGLLATFTVVLARAAVLGLTLSCGCFGPAPSAFDGWGAAARNVVLVALALAVLAISRGAADRSITLRLGPARGSSEEGL